MAPTLKRASIGGAKKRRTMTKEEQIERIKAARSNYSGRITKPSVRLKTKDEPIASSSEAFEADPEALEMIKTGNIRIGNTTNRASAFNSRPSVAARPSFAPRISVAAGRPSITGKQSVVAAGRPSVAGRPSIARNPRATVNEPRPSLLPLGINIFEANESQRQQVSLFLKNQSENKKSGEDSMLSDCATPSKFSVFGVSQMSTRKKTTIRFMENAIPEQRESHDPTEEISSPSTTKHSPNPNFIPQSILSSAKKRVRTINLGSPILKESPVKKLENKSTILEDMMKSAEKLIEASGELDIASIEMMNKIEKIFQTEKRRIEYNAATHNTTLGETDLAQMVFIGDEPQPPQKRRSNRFHRRSSKKY